MNEVSACRFRRVIRLPPPDRASSITPESKRTCSLLRSRSAMLLAGKLPFARRRDKCFANDSSTTRLPLFFHPKLPFPIQEKCRGVFAGRLGVRVEPGHYDPPKSKGDQRHPSAQGLPR